MRHGTLWVVVVLVATVLTSALDETRPPSCAGQGADERVATSSIEDTDCDAGGFAGWLAPEGTVAALVAPPAPDTLRSPTRADRPHAGVSSLPEHPPRTAS